MAKNKSKETPSDAEEKLIQDLIEQKNNQLQALKKVLDDLNNKTKQSNK